MAPNPFNLLWTAQPMPNESARIPVSVVILTKNEQKNIAQTIQSVRSFDDVVVVDSASTDGTAEIARSLGARVVQFHWDGSYPKKKQWSLNNASLTHNWVLLLDADERPSNELIREIASLATSKGIDAGPDAYDIGLMYRFAGRVLRFGHRVTKRSLLDRSVVRFPEVGDLDAPGIREVEGHYQPKGRDTPGHLRGRIIHDDRDPVSTWFDRHNRYSDWEAHLRRNRTLRRTVANERSSRGSVFDRVPAKPAVFFIYSYVLRLGFLDGRAGFDYAIALSLYYWQIGLKVRELEHD